MVEIKNNLIHMKNACDELISRLGTTVERISESQNMTIETI